MITRVLIVNDSHMERVIAKETLSKVYMVFEASSGIEAYDILDKEHIDIIFLDNVMKNETGYDIAKRLRKNSKYDNIPLVLMSSNDNPINEMEAFESGFNAYMHKSDVKNIISVVKSFEKKDLDKPVQVLVVDDSKIIRTMLAYTFNKEGFTVKTAESGEQALEILKTYQADFITMDVEMGEGLDGFQTSKLIRNNPEFQNIPIIMITNIDTVESRVKGFESGIIEYFTKPFEPIKLIDYIKNVVLKLHKQTNKKILVIEESLSTQHIISYIMKQQGFNVTCQSKIDEIWDVFNREIFELILIDFDLGIIQSYELCRRLKEESKKRNLYIPIIVITSITNKYAIIESFRNGADDYISRPFTSQELLIRVLTHLSYKKNLDESIENYTSVINKDFLSTLSHELRSPLTGIIGTASLLFKKPDKYGINENGANFIKNILDSANSSINIVDNLIYFMNLKLNNFDNSKESSLIEDLIMAAIDELSAEAKNKNIHITLNINTAIKPSNVNSKQIILCVKKLIENSIYYSYNDSEVLINVSQTNDNLIIEIEDFGSGIKEDIRHLIFDPFFSYKAPDIGKDDNVRHSGLGLSIAKEIAIKHNGDITYIPKEKGSIFKVML